MRLLRQLLQSQNLNDARKMAETKLHIYIGKEALEEVLVCDDSYPNLNHIFNNHAVLCVNLTDSELDDILADEESELSQLSRNDVSIIPLKDYFSALEEDQSLVIEKPRAMFFFDISRKEAEELSSKYGIIIQSETDVNDNVLQLSFKKGFDKGDVVSGASDGWTNMLNGQKLPPSNSLIITDNFLLQNDVEGKLIGFENIKMILNAILPKTLETVFHLLIVSPMPQKIRPEKADQLNGMLKAYVKTIRDYDIQFEFVFNNTIHPRKLISNYFVLVCDKGFQLFHPKNKTTIHDENEITLTSVLHDTRNTSGDTVLAISYKDIEKIKKSCVTLREQILGGVKDPTKKIIGDTGKDKSIRNRLLT